MKKEDYIKQKSAIEQRIAHEKELLESLRKHYIDANSIFEIGQKVKIVTPPHQYWPLNGKEKRMSKHEERFAFVDGYSIRYNGDIEPVFKKAKKDGTISLQRDYYNQSYSYLEKA